MEKKNNFLILAGLILLIVVVAVVASFVNKSNFNQGDEAERLEMENQQVAAVSPLVERLVEVNPALVEVVDVEKIDLSQELSTDDLNVIESGFYEIPTTLEEVEIMSEEEKKKMGIDSDLPVQVLGRTADGRPTGYRFITDESSILLDTRN